MFPSWYNKIPSIADAISFLGFITFLLLLVVWAIEPSWFPSTSTPSRFDILGAMSVALSESDILSDKGSPSSKGVSVVTLFEELSEKRIRSFTYLLFNFVLRGLMKFMYLIYWPRSR